MREKAESSLEASFGCSVLILAVFVAFVVLKITGVITWSWWWITAPVWLPFALAGTFFYISIVVVAVVLFLTTFTSKWD